MKSKKIKWIRIFLKTIKWIRLKYIALKQFFNPILNQTDFWLSFIGFISIVIFIGYPHKLENIHYFTNFFIYTIRLIFLSTLIQFLFQYKIYQTQKLVLIRLSYLLFLIILVLINNQHIHNFFQSIFSYSSSTFRHINWINIIALILIFVRQISKKIIVLQKYILNPAQLFVYSFFVFILFGTLLLMLPQCTYNGISFIDALFTSTSAVCVTGLVIADTPVYFTELGQVIILGLIQIGGIGVMSFTGFFALFFQSNFTFRDQIIMKEVLGKSQLNGILKFVMGIIVFTLIIELVGIAMLYASVDESLFKTKTDHLFFAIFHSISAFCNAGFSILPNNLMNAVAIHNYYLQLTIATLIIFGGLGYHVVFNIYEFISKKIKLLFIRKSKSPFNQNKNIKLNVNSKLALLTTGLLIAAGTVLFFITENNSLFKGVSFYEKLISSFFCAVTPRTAGFNTIDFGIVTDATCLLIIFLMWIGASPASTGGGIKTTTFAVAITNIISLGKGKDRLELYNREIDQSSIKRAFLVIMLSILIISIGIFLILIFDPILNFKAVMFEVVSAISTVGLSMGITSKLSSESKIIIILLMFIGRIGAITILTGFIKKVKNQNYRFSSEQILIN